ncbi:extracellular solute-binding protein [Paenibacillus thalictri]|nr:extracellular solute-binding protein [Paenibacillus thalictri]
MKQHRKKGALVAAAVATAVALAGCGGGAKPADSGKAAAGGEAAKPTLKLLVPNNVEEFPQGSDVNNNEIANTIREKTGFNLQWELLPKDAEPARQKLNVVMASGETPDIIILNDKTQFGSFVQQGLLTPLDTYMNDVGKDIKATLTPEQWKSSTAADGKIYAVRTLTFNVATSGLLTRTDWFEELGIPLPKTQDEFYEALKTIKAKKPDAVPYSANLAQGLGSLAAIQSMFYPPVEYLQKNGKVVYTPAEPEAKEFLAFANKLFSEGLIDKEAVVNKLDNVKEKFVSGRAAMSTIGWADAKGIGDALKGKSANAKLGYIDIPTGKNGANGMNKATSLTKYFVIPKFSKHPKEAVDFMNKSTNKDLIDYISFGVEGKHYEKKDGQFIATKEAENIRYRVYYNMFDTVELGIQRMKQKGFAPYFDPLVKSSKYDDVVNLVPPIDAVDKKSKEFSDLRDEYFLKIITGALPMSAYDDYIAKWKKAGGEEALKALNDAYNGNK